MSAPEVLLLVAAPEKGPSLPIFVEVAQEGETWWVRMRGRALAAVEGKTREDALRAAMGFR